MNAGRNEAGFQATRLDAVHQSPTKNRVGMKPRQGARLTGDLNAPPPSLLFRGRERREASNPCADSGQMGKVRGPLRRGG